MIADYLELSLEGQQAAEEFALSSGDDSVVRLNEFEYMPDSHLLLIYLIWLCKFVGMNGSSPLRPAVGYGKIEKRKARDARLPSKDQLNALQHRPSLFAVVAAIFVP